MYAELVASGNAPSAAWISSDAASQKAIVTTLPSVEDVSLPVDVGQVVAFMSR